MKRYEPYNFKEMIKVDEDTPLDVLVTLSNKKAGRDRSDAIIELIRRASLKSKFKISTLSQALNILDIKGYANRKSYEDE
jgi:hypothetical protein